MMFQYASLMGIAACNRISPVLGLSNVSRLTKTFEMSGMPAKTDVKTAKRFRLFREQRPTKYEPRSEHMLNTTGLQCDSSKGIRTWAYLQNTRYFQSIESFIRREFKPRKMYLEKVKALIAKSIDHRNKSVTVGVHIRRTDFSRLKKILVLAYYIHAMAHLA